MRGYHHQPPPPASAALNPPKRHPPFMCAQNNERKHIRIKQNPHPHGHPCQDRLRPPAPTPHTTTNITSHLIPPPERHGKSQNSSSPITPSTLNQHKHHHQSAPPIPTAAASTTRRPLGDPAPSRRGGSKNLRGLSSPHKRKIRLHVRFTRILRTTEDIRKKGWKGRF